MRTYRCAVCGSEYNSIVSRNRCETRCLENFNINEHRKADIVRITNLFHQYSEELKNLDTLVSTLNSELASFIGKYGFKFADGEIISYLNEIVIPDKPSIVKQDADVYVNESDIEVYERYKKYSKNHYNIRNEEDEM